MAGVPFPFVVTRRMAHAVVVVAGVRRVKPAFPSVIVFVSNSCLYRGFVVENLLSVPTYLRNGFFMASSWPTG
jgi:hypothetical protein